MRRIADNPRADNKIMEQDEEFQVVRRTEVTIETHTVTTVRKQPRLDTNIVEPDPVLDIAALVPESEESLKQYKWRRA